MKILQVWAESSTAVLITGFLIGALFGALCNVFLWDILGFGTYAVLIPGSIGLGFLNAEIAIRVTKRLRPR